MGVSQSHSNLYNKENLVSIVNRSESALCSLIKYNDEVNSIERVREELRFLWFRRGTGNKNDIPIMSTFAGQGQGKTELCRQLCLNSDRLKLGLDGVDEMVVILVTFNQDCTYVEKEGSSMSIERSLIWRAMKAFNQKYDLDSTDVPSSFEGLLRDIRASFHGTVGIFVLLDEIMKVPEERRSMLLDIVSSLQQRHIGQYLPTFFMVTSLQYAPVAKLLKTSSGRELTAIPLSILSDNSKENVVRSLTSLLHRILSIGENSAFEKKLKATRDVERLVKVMVSVCGYHFRSLENALKTLYRNLVHLSKHCAALTREDMPRTVLSHLTPSSFVSPLDTVLSASFIKDIFDMPSMAVRDNDSVQLYYKVLNIFLKLINEPAGEVLESNYDYLISIGAVYVKSRGVSMSKIVPRVNLPFLFQYPTDCEQLMLEFDLNSGDGYLSCRNARTLKDWMPLLIHNIGVALYKSVKDLPNAFERVMPWIELVRIHALTKMRALTLLDVLPGAVVVGDENITININEDVLESFDVERELQSSDFRRTKKSMKKGNLSRSSSMSSSSLKTTQMANSKKLIELAAAENCQAAVVSQAEEYHTELIEYVNRYYTVNDQPALGLVSMKLREANAVNPAELADEIKAQLMTSSGCDSKCFVMIYCCLTNAEIARYADSLPSGTVVVGIETLRNVMKPFGVSCLLEVAESEQVN